VRIEGSAQGPIDRRDWLALGAGVALAVAIRVILMPQPGLAGDVGDFLAWARAIGENGLGHAYDERISFPPVLPWIWWLLGTAAPPFLNPTPDDPVALAVLKVPATLADLAMAAIVGWSLALRGHRGWAVVAGLAVLLVPATWYVSALWGQFESLYVLPMLLAWALLTRGRPGWAAVVIAVGLMTKPQALPLVVPFAAYYLRRFGFATSVRAGLVATAAAAVLWLPFLGAGGIARYAGNLTSYASDFASLSLRAWNPWWIVQDLATGGSGQLVSDTVSITGPLTLRWVGVGLAGLLALSIFVSVWRRPTPTGLAWGLAAAGLGAFIALTSMHERYSYPALIFLLLAWPNRLAVWTWLLLAAAVTLNLVAAIPPAGSAGSLIPVSGLVGIIGSIAMTTGLTLVLVGLRRAEEPDPDRLPGMADGR
jgi:hypothetical protein